MKGKISLKLLILPFFIVILGCSQAIPMASDVQMCLPSHPTAIKHYEIYAIKGNGNLYDPYNYGNMWR